MKNIDKILEIISEKKCWITVKNILEKLDNKINKTTIYRNLEKLLKSWEILEDFWVNNEKIYSKKITHHHHFICDKCWIKENIWCFLKPEIQKLQDKFDFKVKNHSLVLSWICGNCG